MDSEDKGLQEFIQQTGFDPRRDLQDVLFASSVRAGYTGIARGVVLARGFIRSRSSEGNCADQGLLYRGLPGDRPTDQQAGQKRAGLSRGWHCRFRRHRYRTKYHCASLKSGHARSQTSRQIELSARQTTSGSCRCPERSFWVTPGTVQERSGLAVDSAVERRNPLRGNG